MTCSILFHIPKPIVSGSAIGSQVRPEKLLGAFQSLNCEVESVTGIASERKKQINRILADMKKGRRFDFLYSESSNAPIPVSDDHHLPVHPLIDYRFYHAVKRHGIPSGLYYRDVFWKFPVFKEKLSLPLRLLTYPLFLSDWQVFRRCINHLFLPSNSMAAHLHTRWPENNISRLPPGCDIENCHPGHVGERLACFYVGGIQPPVYDLKSMIAVFNSSKDASLTLCCRQNEWQSLSGYYQGNMRNVNVVHASGVRLKEHYCAADVFIAAWSRDPYMDIAMPIKIFESLGYGLPVIITAGSEAAQFIESSGAGWVINTISELPGLLNRLQKNRSEVLARQRTVMQLREQHTWVSRAQQIISTLMTYHG